MVFVMGYNYNLGVPVRANKIGVLVILFSISIILLIANTGFAENGFAKSPYMAPPPEQRHNLGWGQVDGDPLENSVPAVAPIPSMVPVLVGGESISDIMKNIDIKQHIETGSFGIIHHSGNTWEMESWESMDLGELEPMAWSCPASSYRHWFDYNNNLYPQSTIGVLTAMTPQGMISCTASVVRPNIILTAGHCVAGGGVWYTGFRFYPGYQNGNYWGVWGGRYSGTFREFFNYGDLSLDVGFVILYPSNGISVGNYVGWLGFTTGHSAIGRVWNQSGYPENLASGQILSIVQSAGGHYMDWYWGSAVGAGSNLGHGSSGGPWVDYISPYGHVANGINSHNILNGAYVCSHTMYSPYFGGDVWNLYQWIQSK